jgi:hypothetical protein
MSKCLSPFFLIACFSNMTYAGGVSSFFSSGFVSGCVAGVGVGVAAEAVSTGVGAAGVSVGLAGAAFGYIRNRTVFQN